MLTLDLQNGLALFGAMALLAALPSISVLAVTSRAVSSGFGAGASVALGVVAGDLLFILVAVLGLAVLVEALGPWFILVRIVGGLYLIWLGISLWRSAGKPPQALSRAPDSRVSGFMTGLFVTLADQKAIFFYLGFFPAFLDLPAMTWLDVALVGLIAAVAVGGAKLVYAWLAAEGRARLGQSSSEWARRAAALVLLLVGLGVAWGATP